jgi:hypothetical protein
MPGSLRNDPLDPAPTAHVLPSGAGGNIPAPERRLRRVSYQQIHLPIVIHLKLTPGAATNFTTPSEP